jgi:hypothetical protein
MPGYIKASLHKYQYPAPERPEHAPHTWNPPMYGANTQFGNETTPSPALCDKEVNKLQQLTGTLLYYARAVDPTLIMPINFLASEQSNSSMSLPLSKTWSPPQPNQKLERAPKVEPHSELHSPSWATHNPRCLYAPITPPHLVS